LHKNILIRNVETNGAFALHGLWKLLAQLAQVTLLHAKNEVRPTNMPLSNDNARTWLSPGRTHLIQRKTIEQSLGSKAAKFVPATDK
jgi:hypothetical protein